MIGFHMLCHRDAEMARALAGRPFPQYFEALARVSREWKEGVDSKDRRDYGKSMAKLKTTTLKSQIESGGDRVGTPSEIVETNRRVVDEVGQFEHASRQIDFGALDFGEARKSMRLFAREAMPGFWSSADATATERRIAATKEVARANF